MKSLLGLLNGFLGYERGRETGLAGLGGIIVTLVIAGNWNHILPILRALGIVDFFAKKGMIFEGENYLTAAYILAFFVKWLIIFVVLFSIFMVLGIIIAMIFSNETAVKIILPLIIFVLSPLVIVGLIFYLLYIKFLDPIINKEKYETEAHFE
ncbi:hypothetical protein [Fictibacillus barbaricus]|uniref:Uncharacterized protein n=1 Tax=Fictibacillus barbaricus TaxID=182136 RepID=A0ABU1U3W3_9BACL|nr:hypothetical protein [Fictibacillus barbaricus]MDR7074171.1 hypothetical protein [Fictibacillus barbaricus]